MSFSQLGTFFHVMSIRVNILTRPLGDTGGVHAVTSQEELVPPSPRLSGCPCHWARRHDETDLRPQKETVAHKENKNASRQLGNLNVFMKM